MKQLFIKTVRMFGKLLGKKKAGQLVRFIHKATDINILEIALNTYGILKYQNMIVSGEIWALEKIIAPNINQDDCLIDVGANVGDYSLELKRIFPSNRIISLEPNQVTFSVLIKNVGTECINKAIGATDGEVTFFTSQENPTSSLSSFSIESIPPSQTPQSITVRSQKMSSLISECNIKRIGLLKVDTEGHDIEVLKSAGNKLSEIKFIQFEFTEYHVYSRTFLRDFYILLSPTHDLFRLDTEYLHDIKIYNPKLEIFRFQNIIAIRKDLTTKISHFIKS